jgi:transposase
MFSLDVSKGTLSCALTDPATRRLQWERTVHNTPEQVERLLARVPAETPWVLEPTGRDSLSVAKQAVAAGRTVLMAPPRKAKQFLASVQSRAKTDRLDARGLGLFALSAALPPYPIRSEAMERLHQLLVARRGLSRALASLKQRLPELPHAKASLQPAIADLAARLKALDRQIAQERRQLPAARTLQQVHGVGPVTAAAVGACLTSKRFPKSDQFVAYVGLDIAKRESGQRKGERGLTRQGDAELRRLLYLCAQASLRAEGSPFRAQYERERQKGLATTAALCAVARKLAKVCWSLVAHGGEYDPARVYSPRSRAAPKRFP